MHTAGDLIVYFQRATLGGDFAEFGSECGFESAGAGAEIGVIHGIPFIRKAERSILARRVVLMSGVLMSGHQRTFHKIQAVLTPVAFAIHPIPRHAKNMRGECILGMTRIVGSDDVTRSVCH